MGWLLVVVASLVGAFVGFFTAMLIVIARDTDNAAGR